MKKDNRTHRIHLRLNDAEMELFKAKARNYKQMSAMIRDAVAQFDDRGTMLRLESLQALSDLIKSSSYELSRQGGNLNQVVKRANEMMIAGELDKDYFEKILLPTVEYNQNLLLEIKKQQQKIFKNLIKK